MVEDQIQEAHQEGQRMEIRSLVNLASEPVSHLWPMQTFIPHNPLHGLEHLSFEEAIEKGKAIHGGKGYLSNEQYRKYYHTGRITEEAVNDVLKGEARNELVEIGSRKISHFEFLRTVLINGTGYLPIEVAPAIGSPSPDDREIQVLIKKLQSELELQSADPSFGLRSELAQSKIACGFTLSEWCDTTFDTKIQYSINQEMIKFCGGFLDEGHAPWPMPLRGKTFYGGWKELAQEDASGWLLGIRQWKDKLQKLPIRPEDAILECLKSLAIPKSLWSDYFTLHLAQLPGWAGYIKWRSEQPDHEWQRVFRINLVKYLAVRLFYEKELLGLACKKHLGIQGTYSAIISFLQEHSIGYGLFHAWKNQELDSNLLSKLNPALFSQRPLPIEKLNVEGKRVEPLWTETRKQQKFHSHVCVLLHLARSFNLSVKELLEIPASTLERLLNWTHGFPECHHGPIWLRAFEATYLKGFLKYLSPNLPKLSQRDEFAEQDGDSRPLNQAIFCIDVRSEGFRRHFEEVGGNETFGFAGFFGVPLCFQEFGSDHETDQCPVLLKPKHVVNEIPRAYQGKAAKRFLQRQKLVKTGHSLFHDLKENVITPYVMVEAIGWFFGFRLFVQTLFPLMYQKIISWGKEHLEIPIGTTLTVGKITKKEAEEMVAAEHRANIYRMLIERFGRRGTEVTHSQVERLRKQALNDMGSDLSDADEEIQGLLEGAGSDHKTFIRDLRQDYDVNERALARRMHRITQTGFTVKEQAYFVETALRTIGFTKSFSRLILICAHGSSSDNNPYESALDCGACGGNQGISNARALAAMANSGQVRHMLLQKGLDIPPDTHFLPGQHDTTTDEVSLFDLEDVPATHRDDLERLQLDLEEAGHRNRGDRLRRLPTEIAPSMKKKALKRVKRRSADWAQVLPEWGLSRHSAFIVGRRSLTQGINLEGRVFLHSYDYLQDLTGKYLEIIMTAPMIVANWINMGYYFSTVAHSVYGGGSKIYHNVVGRMGLMYGSQSDLRVGLPYQTLFYNGEPYHEPMRLFVVIEAPLERISEIISRQAILQRLFGNRWINLVSLDPISMEFFSYHSEENWQLIQ